MNHFFVFYPTNAIFKADDGGQGELFLKMMPDCCNFAPEKEFVGGMAVWLVFVIFLVAAAMIVLNLFISVLTASLQEAR